MYLSKLTNVFVQIDKCICPNRKIYVSKLTNVFVQIDKCICANWKKKSIWVLTSCQQDCQLVTLECDPFCEDANWLYQPMSLSIIFDRLGTFCHWLSGCPPTDYTIWKRTVEKSQIMLHIRLGEHTQCNLSRGVRKPANWLYHCHLKSLVVQLYNCLQCNGSSK